MLPSLNDLLAAFARQGEAARPQAVRAGLRLLTAHAVAAPDAKRAAVVQAGLDALRAGLGAQAVEADTVALAELHLACGQVQKAMELCSRAFRQRPGDLTLAHRLGLALLARAQSTPPADTANAVDRWLRAVAYLTAAAWDESYFADWCGERGRTYRDNLEREHLVEARPRIIAQIRQLLTARAEEVEATHPATGEAMRELLVTLEIDQSGVAVFERALEVCSVTGTRSFPLPFGMTWWRTMESASPEASRTLGSIVEQTLIVPSAGPTAPPEPAADSLGEALRQCYSRLAPVRHALLQGRADSARKAIETLCPAAEGCRPATATGLRKVVSSPTTCDSCCEQFARCNPGYAHLREPGRALAEDAHKLAMRTCLALAGQHVSRRPPQIIHATQEWMRARSLADVLGFSDQFHEELMAQVMGHLEDLAKEPEHTAELLKQALAVLPTESLRGKLCDRLTERGIRRANDGHLDEGAQDLRWALQLNLHSLRARHNLCLLLQSLTAECHNANRRDAALEAAKELVEQATEALTMQLDDGTFRPLLEWAEQYVTTWSGRDPLDVLAQLMGKMDG